MVARIVFQGCKILSDRTLCCCSVFLWLINPQTYGSITKTGLSRSYFIFSYLKQHFYTNANVTAFFQTQFSPLWPSPPKLRNSVYSFRLPSYSFRTFSFTFSTLSFGNYSCFLQSFPPSFLPFFFFLAILASWLYGWHSVCQSIGQSVLGLLRSVNFQKMFLKSSVEVKLCTIHIYIDCTFDSGLALTVENPHKKKY